MPLFVIIVVVLLVPLSYQRLHPDLKESQSCKEEERDGGDKVGRGEDITVKKDKEQM